MKCTPKDDDLERYFYIVDEQGSTTLITNSSADIANEYYYDAFGNILESTEDIHNRITYTGQQFDGTTQQYYLRARFYNPAIGRFIQEDIYRGDGLNLYAYCKNNPVMYYDPSGYVCSGKINQYNEEVKNFEGSRLEYLRNKYNTEGVGEAKFKYKSNPMDNPKAAKDIIENPDAVYGYSLKPESKLNSFGVDWTNPDEVAYAQSERIRYHEHLEQKKTMLKDEISKLQNDGYSMEDIARMKVEQRNQDRINNYIKSNNYDGLEAMKQRNLEEYQRAEGPTADQLYKKYGSWEEVIYSSVRSNPAMDVVTGLYDIYGGN